MSAERCHWCESWGIFYRVIARNRAREIETSTTKKDRATHAPDGTPAMGPSWMGNWTPSHPHAPVLVCGIGETPTCFSCFFFFFFFRRFHGENKKARSFVR